MLAEVAPGDAAIESHSGRQDRVRHRIRLPAPSYLIAVIRGLVSSGALSLTTLLTIG